METIKGFKVFNPDWTCEGFHYEVGHSYEMDDKPRVWEHGFHFCIKAADCFNFYDFNSDNKVAEVEAYGDTDKPDDESIYCTNKIRIVREIPWDEVLRIVNEGKGCTGLWNTGNNNTGDCNTGDFNTGDFNTGNNNTGNCNTGNRNTADRNTADRNTGYYNTGNRNTGSWNTGDSNTGDRNTGNNNTGNYNTGNCNTGDRNTGNYNTGNYNTGNRNTGEWNIISFSSGCFNTQKHKMFMFDKPCDWTLEDWFNSPARRLLNHIQKNVVEWIPSYRMTYEEKAEYPTHKKTGGYLKILDESECAQLWWDNLREEEREVIFSLPNFDEEIFERCTGIKI